MTALKLTALKQDKFTKFLLGLVCALVLAILVMWTWQQQLIYQNNKFFWGYIVAMNPEARNAHLSLGNAFYDENRFVDAVDYYRIAVEKQPNDVRTRAYLGVGLYQMGRYEEAEKHLQRAIVLDPSYVQAYVALGHVWYEQDHYEDALAAYRAVLELDPAFPNIQANLAATLKALGRGK